MLLRRKYKFDNYVIGNKIPSGLIIHFTHNDSDAVGCAFVLEMACNDYDIVHRFCTNAEVDMVINNFIKEYDSEEAIKNIRRGHILDDNARISIIISDIGPSEETVENLVRFADKYDIELSGYDHHKTNHLNEKYDWFKVVSDKSNGELISATRIMYDNLYDIKTWWYDIINDISRYDTWEWVTNPSEKGYENICARIMRIYSINEILDTLYDNVRTTSITSDIDYEATIHIAYYDLLVAYDMTNILIDREKRRLDRLVRVYNNVGYYIPGDMGFISEIASYINNILFENKLDYLVIMYPTTMSLSFRTSRDDIDVSEIAAGYGGGGHKSAAGARVSYDEFMRYFSIYHNTAIPYEELNDNESISNL